MVNTVTGLTMGPEEITDRGTRLTGETEREQQRWRQDSNKHDDKADKTRTIEHRGNRT